MLLIDLDSKTLRVGNLLIQDFDLVSLLKAKRPDGTEVRIMRTRDGQQAIIDDPREVEELDSCYLIRNLVN